MDGIIHCDILRTCPQFADGRLQVSLITRDLRDTLRVLDRATEGRAYVSRRLAVEEFLTSQEALRLKYSDPIAVEYRLLVNISRADLVLVKLVL